MRGINGWIEERFVQGELGEGGESTLRVGPFPLPEVVERGNRAPYFKFRRVRVWTGVLPRLNVNPAIR